MRLRHLIHNMQCIRINNAHMFNLSTINTLNDCWWISFHNHRCVCHFWLKCSVLRYHRIFCFRCQNKYSSDDDVMRTVIPGSVQSFVQKCKNVKSTYTHKEFKRNQFSLHAETIRLWKKNEGEKEKCEENKQI